MGALSEHILQQAKNPVTNPKPHFSFPRSESFQGFYLGQVVPLGLWLNLGPPNLEKQTLTPNPKPQTPNPKPQTPNPKPQTLNPKP